MAKKKPQKHTGLTGPATRDILEKYRTTMADCALPIRRLQRAAPFPLAALNPVRVTRALTLDNYRRADIDQAIEFADVAVVHADTAMRDEAADQFRAIGAMDDVFAAAAGSASTIAANSSACLSTGTISHTRNRWLTQ
jgi:hypothetical protein